MRFAFTARVAAPAMVEDIETRATVISTPDGHRAVISNAVLFTNPVVVRNRDNKNGLEANEGESVSARH
jgi:small-conductance mechanosensitive channel